MKGLFLSTVLLGVACAGLAHANTITGSLYRVTDAASQDAIPGNVPAGTADVTFSVNSPFNFSATDATINAWLASSGAFDIVENTPGTLSSRMDNGTTGTLVNFVGNVSVANGQQFTVTHDDGLTLIIGALDLGFNPGPTPSHNNHSHLYRTDRKLRVPAGVRRMLRRASCAAGRFAV